MFHAWSSINHAFFMHGLRLSCIFHEWTSINHKKDQNTIFTLSQFCFFVSDFTKLKDETHLNIASSLLQIDPEKLSDSLTKKRTKTGGEEIISPVTLEKCYDIRDAFVKRIYSRLFEWIVRKINQTINNEQLTRLFKNVGVLDIFGFEIFEKNSFEQFCINFANEHLQQFFVHHIFKLEQKEYNSESINWQHIEFTDNQSCLDMLVQKPMNLFALLDEESKFPRGTNGTFLNKIAHHHGDNKLFKRPKDQSNLSFTVTHFAGDVIYDCDKFLEKNRDTFNSDLLSMTKSSGNEFLLKLFHEDIQEAKGTVLLVIYLLRFF